MRCVGVLLLLATLPARSQPGPEARALIDAVLAAPETVILLSLEPDPPDGRMDADGNCLGSCFHGWSELGRVALRLESERRAALAELQAWVQAAEPEAVAMCFDPRHALVVRGAGHELSFLVCYECESTEVYEGSSTEPLATLYRQGSGEALDALLRRHGMVLARPADEDQDQE